MGNDLFCLKNENKGTSFVFVFFLLTIIYIFSPFKREAQIKFKRPSQLQQAW